MYKTIIKPALVLVIICAVVSGLLAFTYNAAGVAQLATAGLKDDQLAEAGPVALPGSTSLSVTAVSLESEEVLAVYTDEGGAGYAFYVSVKGYKDGLKMLVGITPEGAVAGISVVEHQETDGIGTKAMTGEYLGKFVGKTGSVAVEASGGDVDAISGATYTSKGIGNGVNAALSAYEQVKGELAQ